MNNSLPTYLALGDSYTIGEGVDRDKTWPYLLAKQLGWHPPQVIATTGWKTFELLAALENAELATRYDWVSLLIGVNNQYRQLSFELFREDLERLSSMMHPLVDSPSRIFLLSIPDYSVTPFVKDKDRERIAAELQEYNRYKEEFAHWKGYQFCNITDLSQLADGDSTLIADDALHPSAVQYRMWVSRILQNVRFEG